MRRRVLEILLQEHRALGAYEILDRLLLECRTFQDQVRAGTAKLGDKRVDIVPPDPIGELGSGIEKIAKGHVEQISIGES